MGKGTAAVVEAPFHLHVNGRRIASWTCTPERLEALAVGRLVAEGYLDDRHDLLEFAVVGGGDGEIDVHVRLAPGRAAGREPRIYGPGAYGEEDAG